MGEIVDSILNGEFCERCGSFIIEEGCGFPVLCEDCENDED